MEDNDCECGFINNCKICSESSHNVQLEIENCGIEFEVYTGACETIINMDYFENYFKNYNIYIQSEN